MRGFQVSILVALVGVVTGSLGYWRGAHASRADDVLHAERCEAGRRKLEAQVAAFTAEPRTRVPCPKQNSAPTPTEVRAAIERGVQQTLQAREQLARLEAEELARPSIENEIAFADGEGFVDRALRDGVWDTTDAQSINAVLPQVTAEQGAELLRRVAVEVNEGRVSVGPGGILN